MRHRLLWGHGPTRARTMAGTTARPSRRGAWASASTWRRPASANRRMTGDDHESVGGAGVAGCSAGLGVPGLRVGAAMFAAMIAVVGIASLAVAAITAWRGDLR
mgnify:CR=1 FL=1